MQTISFHTFADIFLSQNITSIQSKTTSQIFDPIADKKREVGEMYQVKEVSIIERKKDKQQ